MNSIINLIVRIFNAAFEQDYDRRTGGQSASSSQPSQPTGRRITNRRSLEAFLDRTLGQQQGAVSSQSAPTHAAAPSHASQSTPRRRSRGQRVGTGHRRGQGFQPRVQTSESLQESAPLGGTEMLSFNQRAEPLKVKHASKKQHKAQFDLPGNSTLAKMIYANVILGPCKAHARRGMRKRI